MIYIYKDYDAMSRAAADLVVNQLAAKPESLICVPSGDSPAGMLRYLVQDAEQGRVDFSYCTFVALDEWVGLGAEDDGSCTRFLNEHFFSQLDLLPGQVRFFDAKAADLDAECRLMNEFIAERGPLDMMIVGVGMNGHIGLNEPGTDFNRHAHHSPLDPVTVAVGQKYFKKQTVLTEGITLGLKHLQDAAMPVLLASGSKKAGIIAKALQGEVSEMVPASILQIIPQALVLLDEGAAAGLDH